MVVAINVLQLKKSWLLLLLIVLSVLTLPMGFAIGSDDHHLWTALKKGGHVALLRHALAPGTGDPANFQLDDCTTQRNLSEEGRAQATRIGERFREHGISSALVYSSQWCRCKDTATLLDFGKAQPFEVLNSFYQKYDRKEKQTALLERWIRSGSLDKPLIIVTHQVNITALTGVFPASGELVVVNVQKGEPLVVVGTVLTN